jgi:hypothetical protein
MKINGVEIDQSVKWLGYEFDTRVRFPMQTGQNRKLYLRQCLQTGLGHDQTAMKWILVVFGVGEGGLRVRTVDLGSHINLKARTRICGVVPLFHNTSSCLGA